MGTAEWNHNPGAAKAFIRGQQQRVSRFLINFVHELQLVL